MKIDKFIHALLCLIITLMAGLILLGLNCPLAGCLVGGAMPALTAGITKEWCDKTYGNRFDLADLLADLAGIAIGIGILSLIIIFG